MTSIPMARSVAGKGFVHSFEPQRRCFDLLKENAQRNNANNVVAHNFCVGHKHANVNMNAGQKTGIFILSDALLLKLAHLLYFCIVAGGVKIGTGGDAVRMITLDSFRFTDVSFIKIDVEGAERLVCL
jgi:FkbM family methyltransferase